MSHTHALNAPPVPPTFDLQPYHVTPVLVQVFPSSFTYSLSEAGEVVVSTPRDLFTAANLKKFDCPWEKKVNTAFFRGTATGKTLDAAWVQILRIADAGVALLF
jgi:hypothetical protein